MTSRCEKEGLRAPLFCAILLLAPCALAQSQDTVERSLLKACAAQPTRTERLECFERIAAGPSTEDSPPALADRSNPAGGKGSADRTPDAANEAQSGRASTVVKSTRANRATGDSAATALGNEHLRRTEPEDKPDVVTIVVKEAWKAANRRIYFQFDNGQVWRQMESGYISYPRDGEFEVTIRQGVMGDYQLRVADRGRMTRIVRVK